MIKRDDIKALIEGCINKDEVAWTKFVNHFTGLVRWAIVDRLQRWGIRFNNEDIEDIKQSLFSNIWEKNSLAKIKESNKIESWLVIVTGNFAFNYMRTRGRGNPPSLESIFMQNLRIEDISDTRDIYSSLIGDELEEIINNFIGQLPSHQQTALVLNYFYNKKHREIAEILKIPIKTVSTIINRTGDSLRKELRRKGYKNF